DRVGSVAGLFRLVPDDAHDDHDREARAPRRARPGRICGTRYEVTAERMFELVQRYGRDTVSFQGLESGYGYFFDGDDAGCADVDTGGAWVAAGGPIAPPARMLEVATRFAHAAEDQGRRTCFFA